MSPVTVAAVQAAPEFLDRDAMSVVLSILVACGRCCARCWWGGLGRSVMEAVLAAAEAGAAAWC